MTHSRMSLLIALLPMSNTGLCVMVSGKARQGLKRVFQGFGFIFDGLLVKIPKFLCHINPLWCYKPFSYIKQLTGCLIYEKSNAPKKCQNLGMMHFFDVSEFS